MARATLSRPATVERRCSKRWTASAQNGGAVTIRGTTTGDRTLRSTTSYLRGTEHEHLPAEFLNGGLIVKEYRDEPVIYTDRRTNLPHSFVSICGRWVARTDSDDILDLAVAPGPNV
ncbi:MAG: hypothetical protein H7288_00840 [Kineosporiaceae bacterium]|nr:hypothetical protein [Aeromicrobium sp.]